MIGTEDSAISRRQRAPFPNQEFCRHSTRFSTSKDIICWGKPVWGLVECTFNDGDRIEPGEEIVLPGGYGSASCALMPSVPSA
jgi:hypothetical protein